MELEGAEVRCTAEEEDNRAVGVLIPVGMSVDMKGAIAAFAVRFTRVKKSLLQRWRGPVFSDLGTGLNP
jgi:hypothetical protein